jgi:cyclic pyranopterin monophosphate synthase
MAARRRSTPAPGTKRRAAGRAASVLKSRKNAVPLQSSHLDRSGRVAMVDVGEKSVTRRRALAEARLRVSRPVLDAVRAGKMPKGDVGSVVRLAAIGAAKETFRLIPLCHPIPIERIHVDVKLGARDVRIRVEVSTTGKTGVEVEAMTGAAVGALAFYDMVKGMERGVTITSVSLLEKEGGRSGAWRRRGGSRK